MKSQLQFGASVVISPDYRDRIKESYPGYDVNGGYGWQKLDLNYSHSLTERLYMNHRMSLAFNYLIVDGEKDETYFNALLLPAIGLRYQIEPIYFFALANYALPYTGKEQFDFSVDRPGFELGLGTHLGSKLYAELSYLKAPFEFNGKSDNFGGGYTLGFGAKF